MSLENKKDQTDLTFFTNEEGHSLLGVKLKDWNELEFFRGEKGHFLTNSAYFISGENLKYLVSVLNSSVSDYYFFQITAKIAGGRKRYTKQYAEQIPIPVITKQEQGIEYKMFDREFQRIIEEENKEFLKQALQRKLEAEEEEDLRTSFEFPVANYDNSKFSLEALQKFIKEANLNYKPNTFEAPSLSRNHILTYAFSLMDYMEEKGFGMKTFKSLNKVYDLPIPKYTFKEPFLTLTFPRTVDGVKSTIEIAAIGNLSDEELKYFEIFREKDYVNKSQFIEFTGLPERSAQRQLKKWVDEGIIISEGGGRSTKYKTNE